jgi:hypothetical protein
MALAATIVFEIRTGGSDLNGGGFNSTAAGTDRSQQTAAQLVIDNAAVTCTTPAANSNTLTFTLGYVPSAADVGNLVNIAGGTNINAGVYEITAAAGATWTLAGAANLTTAGGAGSAITGRMGGCMASPGKVGSVMVAGNDLYVRQATYNITSATQQRRQRLPQAPGRGQRQQRHQGLRLHDDARRRRAHSNPSSWPAPSTRSRCWT